MEGVGVTRESDLSEVLGEKAAKTWAKVFGYRTVGELLEHYPRRYTHRGELTPLEGIPVGEQVSIVAEVVSVTSRPMHKRKGSILEVVITDGTGLITLTFFNQAWRAQQLRAGVRGIFAGKVGVFRGGKQLSHPDYELFEEQPSIERSTQWAETPIPLYPSRSPLASWQIHKAIALALDGLEPQPDPLPEELRAQHKLTTYDQALRGIHQPQTDAEWRDARETLRFHEALILQLALLRQRDQVRSAGASVRRAGDLLARFDAALPFSLTGDQVAVGRDIAHDLESGHPMHRLVQGEVGSGKTVVALRAMLQVAEDGGQTALLAPTEVLAAQHLRSIVSQLGPDLSADLMPTLLTGGQGAELRKTAQLRVASGQARIVVGTHALLSAKVTFADLGLVVVDEQHRFGVTQRDILRHKGTNPHVLVLTATPIPRTVAMTVFGDVDVSTIRELPAGRAPITTHVVALADHPDWYPRIWARVEEEIESGHQVFVVAPVIDPSDTGELGDELSEGGDEDAPTVLTGVLELAQTLRQHEVLGKRRIGVLHGRLDSAAKDEVMGRFQRGEIDVLVATTVIEVGVDVPRATAMIVMDADRFGISQLHQLRGRVGRGGWPGLCLLVTHAPAESLARERLEAVASTLDGFELAQRDLELRREGDVLGERQSGGRSGLKLLRVSTDSALIETARASAQSLLQQSPDLSSYPQLADHLEQRLAQVDREFLARS